MNKKTTRILCIVAAIVLVCGLIYMSTGSKNTTIYKGNDISIVVNQDFKVEEYEGRHYLYIPINHDLTDVEVKVTKDRKEVEDTMFENYIRAIDTLIPGERIEEFDFEGNIITLHLIIE